MTPRVLLAQCLCPQQHCQLAVAEVTADAAALLGTLQTGVQQAHRAGQPPCCDTCGAPAATWTYAVVRTAYVTIDEALPALRALCAAPQHTDGVLRALGLSGPPPPLPEDPAP